MPTEAAVTAIICMQPYVRDTRDYALNRMAGTLIGAVWGLAFLMLLLLFPILQTSLYLLYLLMSIGVLLSLYTSVAFHKPDASSLSAIVFICVVIAFPDIEDPLRQAIDRILGVAVGTAVAVVVNVLHLPRVRDENKIFFLRAGDLVPDRYAQISPAVLFRLNSLLQDGAKICLVSRHAPAFFTSQLSVLAPTLPMIVMDGAAIYDVNENCYVWTEPIPTKSSLQLRQHLEHLGRGYFLYTVHRSKTCIFHIGELTDTERMVLDRMRRTPYRSYLDEDNCNPEEIVCIKIIGKAAEIELLFRQLQSQLRSRRFRASIQAQTGFPNVSGLYIYSEHATIRNAERRLLQILRENHPDLQPEEKFSSSGYRSEHDAMVLLYQLQNSYAPVRLQFHLRNKHRSQ